MPLTCCRSERIGRAESTNPLSVIEQIAYLLLIKRLPELQRSIPPPADCALLIRLQDSAIILCVSGHGTP
jgi:hypothetical protein